ncbi:hypothetical protein [Adlercreutzia shanghongiae]|uniref:Prealbumin-like fold domain-containing protein n=1 Tax=Adlercreutzia shanghongiae TaxID=3111773 RepID=A0ABU6IZA6_9ACTN|nr:hypothetical protein [Adlercreutzia sp. R22]MEC4295158.1 hypothetical protein [Adlercreutzia sp. R22]
MPRRALTAILPFMLLCGIMAMQGCGTVQEDDMQDGANVEAGVSNEQDVSVGSDDRPGSQSTVGEGPSDAEYPSGSYLVGDTLPPGEYVFEPDPSGRYKVYESLDSAELLDEGLFEGPAILTVSEGQRIELDHARATPFERYPHELNPDRRAGMYKVGVDIPAGTYRAVAPGEDRGYWNITGSSEPGRTAIASGTFSGSDTFTVEDGQYLRFNRCNISLIQ